MTATINASTTAGVVITPDNSGALGLQTAGTTAVTVDTSQNVGIGGAVTNEGGYAKVLQITGSTDCVLELKAGSSYSYLAQNGTNLQIRNNDASGAMTFATNATERMRIDSSGYVLVGCTAYPSSSVAGAALSPSVVSVNPHRFSVGSGTGVITVITFVNGNGIVGAINTSGSNTVYSTSSDYRLKNNIAPMTGALTKVSRLKPCTYTWKADGSDGEGFIAHELAEVFPDAVVGEKDAVDADGEIKAQSIDTSFLVATLTAAIQELKAEVDALKAKVGE